MFYKVSHKMAVDDIGDLVRLTYFVVIDGFE